MQPIIEHYDPEKHNHVQSWKDAIVVDGDAVLIDWEGRISEEWIGLAHTLALEHEARLVETRAGLNIRLTVALSAMRKDGQGLSWDQETTIRRALGLG